jgi:hypothetical protein
MDQPPTEQHVAPAAFAGDMVTRDGDQPQWLAALPEKPRED